ncbi:DUF3551 domain-containing protein [Bradyrhizobium sp. SRS-191]|uniref:DUF3551 domain-containing protein n=1 Tax=Bradyrhizobium sp. SRS-191 TaxID=2962606 RepID=UPI0027B90C51|nr:DUF3551 domain-containing protein [Bradyrhizobium sp. SRS-191]
MELRAKATAASDPFEFGILVPRWAMMRALLVMASITVLATVPAAAQQFDGRDPVCLQIWEWGGSTTISCQYRSWDACKVAAASLSAMCLLNPYGQSPPERSRRSPHR